MSTLENRFNEEMNGVYFSAKKELGYNVTRFMQLVSQKGGLRAAKQLIRKEVSTYGFEVLWESVGNTMNCLQKQNWIFVRED